MSLEDPELFRSWLFHTLGRKCKGDPEAVTKYIFALVRKRRPKPEWRDRLITQLEVFFQEDTRNVVDLLFEAFEKKTYSSFVPPAEDNISEVFEANNKEATDYEQSEDELIIDSQRSGSLMKSEEDRSSREREVRRTRMNSEEKIVMRRRSRSESSVVSAGSPPRDSRADRSQQFRSRSRSRSSHSSPGQDRKLYSFRGRSRRPFYGPRRRFGYDGPAGKYFRRREPFRKRARGESESPGRLRSPGKMKMKKKDEKYDRYEKSDESPESAKYTSKKHSFYEGRDRKRTARSDSGSPGRSNRDKFGRSDDSFETKYPAVTRQKCSAYEGQGYCMLGAYCPFDHGNDPLVLSNPTCLPPPPLPPQPPQPVMPYQMPTAPIPPSNQYDIGGLMPPAFVNFQGASSLQQQQNAVNTACSKTLQAAVRQLVNVKTAVQNVQNRSSNQASSRGHVYSSSNGGVSQCTVEISGIPTELNTIPIIYNYFSKFGTVTLVQIRRNENADRALVTFSNATEASLAYNSGSNVIPGETLSVCWFTDDCIFQPKNTNLKTKLAMAQRKYAPRKQLVPATPMYQPIVRPVQTRAPRPQFQRQNIIPTPSIPKYPTRLPENVIKTASLLNELLTRNKVLLQKYITHQKEIQRSIQNINRSEAEKKIMKETSDILNKKIQETREDIAQNERKKKEFLRNHNIPSLEYAISLRNLMNVDSNIIVIQGDEQSTSEAREMSPVNHDQPVIENVAENSVDVEEPVTVSTENDENVNREEDTLQTKSGPKYTRVLISGFENGDEFDVLTHFAMYGTIVDNEIDMIVPQIEIVYDNHYSAEIAKEEGKEYQDRTLSVTIVGDKKKQQQQQKKQNVTGAGSSSGQQQTQFRPSPYKYSNVASTSTSLEQELDIDDDLDNFDDFPKMPQGPKITLTEEEDLETFLRKGGIDINDFPPQ